MNARAAVRDRAVLATFVALACCGLGACDSPDPHVAEGNRHYAAARHAEALAAYDRALARGPDPRVDHDRGVALYRLASAAGNSDEFLARAEEAFGRASTTEDRRLAAAVHYDLGNTLLLQGRHADAITAYQRVLRRDPDHADARYNLGLALALGARNRGQNRGQNSGPDGTAPGNGDEREGAPGPSAGAPGALDPSVAPPVAPPVAPSIAGGPSPPSADPNERPDPGGAPGRSDPGGVAAERSGQTTPGRGEPPERPPGPGAAPPARSGEPGAVPERTGEPPGGPDHIDRKLDALERMSRDLHRRGLRRRAARSGWQSSGEDW